jgi:hypothetical protein
MECFTFLAVDHSSEPERATCPVLHSLAVFSKSALKRRYDLAVIFLGSHEARYGTDLGEFRKALDLMSGLLKSRGCEHVALVSPVAPPALLRRTERYRRAASSVAYAAAARVFDPQAIVGQEDWGKGRQPSAAVQKALAREIERFVEAVTVR